MKPRQLRGSNQSFFSGVLLNWNILIWNSVNLSITDQMLAQTKGSSVPIMAKTWSKKAHNKS